MEAVEGTTFSFSSEAPVQPDRRRQPRHLTILRVGSLIRDGRRELCLIRNISAGGVMAHVHSAFSEGDGVAIELKSNQPVPGRVKWVQGTNIGIAFDKPIDVEEMLSSQMQEEGWRPRLPRVEVDCLATLRLGASFYGVSTCDISQGGVKVETDRPFDGGAEVVLSLDRFRPVAGVVRWYHEGLCGIAFNQVIPFNELMGWLKAKSASGSAGPNTVR